MQGRSAISGRSLGVNEKLVLSAIQHDSRKSVREIASELSMRHHTVSYVIAQLKEYGIIRPYVLVNPHAVGLTDYCIFFNYVGKEKGARKKILEHCLTSRKVSYFAELSGPYQYTISLFCSTIFEITNFFESLSDKLSDSGFDMSFALRLQFAQFTGRWHSTAVEPHVIDRREVKNLVRIDETDQKILGFYSQNASLSLEKVGEFAGVSEASVRKRLSMLEKNEVINAYAYFADLAKVNMTTFRVIISGGGMKTSFRDELYSYAKAHPSVSAFVHCAGAWDFELNFDLSDRTGMGTILEDINDTFGTYIRSMHTISEIAVHRAHHFPLEAGKRVLDCGISSLSLKCNH